MSKKIFDFDTISDFDNHISASIMGYDLLHSLIISISEFFIFKGSLVYDLGCTTGSLAHAIAETHGCRVIGIDITDSNFIDGPAELKKSDITKELDLTDANVVMSVFTLQFIPVKKRQAIVDLVYNSLEKGGAFIFCEKERSIMDHVFEFSNYENKRRNFSADEILNKEKAIRTVMHPLDQSANIEILNSAGFSKIEVFFKSLNFTGYLCKK